MAVASRCLLHLLHQGRRPLATEVRSVGVSLLAGPRLAVACPAVACPAVACPAVALPEVALPEVVAARLHLHLHLHLWAI